MNEDETLEHVHDRAFNDRRYFVDTSKLKKLEWTQKQDWRTGLVRALRMYFLLRTENFITARDSRLVFECD